MQRSGVLLGLYILVAVIFLIIPIPTLLLDFLILLNISLALIILFTALFSKEALQMSAFPTILLMTTLFRLSLNVGSTRNILLNGYAGNVVATFGDFVGGGNLIVGVIIFAVLILIQMIVINKGSERVSEVTARFTLDAMPGKQMAIDADLNTGAITDEQAKERRQKIQDEAAFFGSMDGATKYVKGDATAGLIITAINFVGGLVLGIMMQGLSMDEALQKYTILTIGDGLVSQIPSLIISLSTGILVTKVSKESDLGGVLMRQLFSIPKVLYIVGGTMVFLGIGTPLQTWICLVYAVMFIAVGRVMESSMEEQEIEEEVTAEEETAEEIRRPENVVSLLQVDPIELEFGYGIIPLADVNQGGDLLDRVVMIRRQIALELCCVVPMIRLRDNIQLNPNQYVIKIKGVPVSELEIVPAGKARNCGIDESMVMAYGQDDRVCAYTSMVAMLEAEDVEKTTCCLLTDKEEIGSVGATGMQSHFFENTVAEIMNAMGCYNELALRRCLASSRMLSSDVSAGYDPTFASAFDKKNAAIFGEGMVFNKFTGARGKSGSNDANAEYLAAIRKVMDDAGVYYQTAELGKVDVGGGGTIAYILSLYGMEVVDCGVAVLNMHAPWEITSKADIYETKKGYVAFLLGA